MISTFSSSDKHWWQLGLLIFCPKTVLQVITVGLSTKMALLQVCVMGCLKVREVQVSSHLTRDQETGLSSRSFRPSSKWSPPASFSHHTLILHPCRHQSSISPSAPWGSEILMWHQQWWSVWDIFMHISTPIVQGTRELESLHLSCFMALVTSLYLSGCLRQGRAVTCSFKGGKGCLGWS